MSIKEIENINTFIESEDIIIYLEYRKNGKGWIFISPNSLPFKTNKAQTINYIPREGFFSRLKFNKLHIYRSRKLELPFTLYNKDFDPPIRYPRVLRIIKDVLANYRLKTI